MIQVFLVKRCLQWEYAFQKERTYTAIETWIRKLVQSKKHLTNFLRLSASSVELKPCEVDLSFADADSEEYNEMRIYSDLSGCQ